MAEKKSSNVGSASHLGEDQLPRDSHFIFDYTTRRVPIPVFSYMAVADSHAELPKGEPASNMALKILGELLEPAVIAEEELNGEVMEKLIREAFSKINATLIEQAAQQGVQALPVSMTMAITDARRAYIGHVGNNRIYLYHQERLYDLTPTGELSGGPLPPQEESMRLFDVGSGKEENASEGPVGTVSQHLGQEKDVVIGYNEVEIVPSDMLVLCTDGLWKTVSEEEIVDNLQSAMNVQRGASQLTKLAFSRESTDNATLTVWEYVPPGESTGRDQQEAKSARRKESVAEFLIVTLLVLVLCGIFAVGFAFGWRITDAFRKPQKESAQQGSEKAGAEETEEQVREDTSTQPAQDTASVDVSAPRTAIVEGEGVRMRETADPRGKIVGLLRNGQEVTILGEVMGTDSKTWSRAKGTVRASGKDIEGEGYIRNDFLQVSGR